MILIFCYGTHGSGCGVAHTDDPTFTYTHVLTSARIAPSGDAGVRVAKENAETHIHTRLRKNTYTHNRALTHKVMRAGSHVAFRYARTAAAPATLLNIIARQYGLGTLRYGFSVGIRAALFALLVFKQKLWFCFRNICFHIWIAHCLALPC